MLIVKVFFTGHHSIMQLVKVNRLNVSIKTVLFIWVSSIIFPGHVDVVRALIEAGATINATDLTKYTPLHLAAFNG